MKRTGLIALLAVLGCTGQDVGAAEIRAARTPAAQRCDRAQLARALTVDTTRLRRTEWEGPSEESSEGESVTFFTQGGTPRLVVVTAFGEMGRAEERYFLTTPQSFVVRREEVRYAEPIYSGEPRVVSRDREEAYVCDGRALPPATELGTDAPQRLRTILTRLSSATGE